MTGVSKNQVSASGFAPHVEELHDFFRSRSLRFGAPDNLGPFVERLQKDESFRDEMSSMVRAIIYRERDGLRPDELLELLVTAVAGTPAEDAPEQVREAVRQMMGFIRGVFRSRWNPGGSAMEAEDTTDDKAAVEFEAAKRAAPLPLAEDAAAGGAPAEMVARPVTPIFYQAQMVANGEEPEGVLPLRQANDAESQAGEAATLALSADEEMTAPPVTAFLRGDGPMVTAPPPEPGRGRSRVGMWVAFVIVVVLAFGAGMFARQWMLLRSGVAAPVANRAATSSQASSGAAYAPAGGAAGVRSGGKTAAQRPAQVEAARSAWQGGTESATDLAGPTSARTGSAAPGGSAGSAPMATAAKPSPEVRANGLRSAAARAPGIVGASPGLMSSRLLFAPEPEYPAMARLTHVQGRVVVEAEVGADGSVVWARAISGHRMLRAAAERAVYGRKYRPYIVNDRPTKVQTLITVNFRLP